MHMIQTFVALSIAHFIIWMQRRSLLFKALGFESRSDVFLKVSFYDLSENLGQKFLQLTYLTQFFLSIEGGNGLIDVYDVYWLLNKMVMNENELVIICWLDLNR
jgi:hypothetical protein